MRALIVDDEAPARARLRRLLMSAADVQVVGEASNGADALQLAAELAPDVLFLDVQMPLASGLDVAASLPDPAPAVVFVTAFDHYAVQAFDAAAVDYLLKPVEPERLALALQRLRGRQGAVLRPAPPAPQQLLLPDRGRTLVLAVADILWLQAADNYVVLHTDQQTPLMRRTLQGLLQDLGSGFVRTHRSAAVALKQVAAVQTSVKTQAKGDAVVVLHNGVQVPCSRAYRTGLMARLASP